MELLLVMVVLGYFTLLERKVLGYGQFRKGPNKGVVWGLFQPMLDGFKLFMKGYWGAGIGGLLSLWGFPVVGLSVVLVLWGWLSVMWGVGSLGMVLFFMVLFGSFVGTCFFVAGYFSGGKYSQLGSVRSLAQVITYEGVLVLGVLMVAVCSVSGEEIEGIFLSVGLVAFAVLVVSVVMESNRTPVDYVEGESELVSGLVTEMGGLSFSLLFLMEYGIMSLYAVVLSFLLWGVGVYYVWQVVTILVVVFGMCVLRLVLPRSRYDLSMGWGWKLGLIVVFLCYLVSLIGMF
uniref:NADH-ubiquinone oxidoreductase chain 1 n=1 Tax=Sphaerirostris lanceoides TaxID=2169581 RepID=A0A6M8YH65_9BILA|nr:NADH dehydrogenase subunit 1 [Sphaerirostris lanceoides]